MNTKGSHAYSLNSSSSQSELRTITYILLSQEPVAARMNVGCDVTFNLGHLDGSQPISMVASLGRSVGGGPVGKRKRGDIGDESHNKHHEAPPSVSPSLSLTGAAGASRSVDGSVQPFLDDHPTDSLSLSQSLSHTHTRAINGGGGGAP